MRCGLDGLLRAPTVFSTPAAREAGVSAARLRRGDVVSLGWGLWGRRGVEPDPMDHLRALQDLHPEGVFSHVTAARVLGLWLTGPLAADRSVHIATPRGHGTASSRAGICSHRLRVDAPVRIVDGVRVTAPGWIFVDLAAQAGPLEHLVALGDSMVRTAPTEARRRRLPPGVTDVAELRAAVEERGRVRGIRAAREEFSETPVETFVLSMAHHASDVLCVQLLARRAGLLEVDEEGRCTANHLRVSPLFETVDDLRHGPEVLRDLGEYRYLIYGLAIIAIVRLKPEGLSPSAIRHREAR